jgi:hypothetical protein
MRTKLVQVLLLFRIRRIVPVPNVNQSKLISGLRICPAQKGMHRPLFRAFAQETLRFVKSYVQQIGQRFVAVNEPNEIVLQTLRD